jgi:hypothetical protein
MSDETEIDVIEAEEWPRTVTLRHPVDFGKERITSLEFRRGQLGDLKGVKLGESLPVESVCMVASRLCGKSVKIIELLDAEDAGEVTEIAMRFFARCLSTGPRRSQR